MLKDKTAKHILNIVEQLQHAGFETYIVGGAVRDIMLERTPKDYDISTSATPEQIRAVFGRRRAFIIGRRFRLVHLRHGGETIEISTFRKAPDRNRQAQKSKRTPAPENMIFHDNEFGTAEEDAWRRDFTVNAIFFDPVGDTLLDFTQMGLDDLANSRVRAIGDPALRFEEDPVRLLRALKLVGQYDFQLEQKTQDALRHQMHLIQHASSARLNLEFEKILKNTYSDTIIEAFYNYGLLEYYLPFIERKWDSDACRYMLELLAEKNRRVRQGLYRESISISMAVISLPFAEALFGSGCSGKLWTNHSGIESEIRKLIGDVFTPHILTKRLCIAAKRTLLIQPKLFALQQIKKLVRHPSYSHGRELLMIQNAVCWKNPELEKSWPKPDKKRVAVKRTYKNKRKYNSKKATG